MPYGNDFMQRYQQNKKAYCRLVDADKGCVIWHDGQATESGTAVTAATVTAVADTSITLKVNAAVDSRIGSSGVLAVGTYSTFAKIANAINVAQGWHCQLVDARGADASSNIDAVSETSCFKNAGVAIERDNSDTLHFGCGIVPYGYGFGKINPTGKHRMDKGKQVFLEHAYADLVFNDGSYLFEIYDCDDDNQTDELIHQQNGAATTVLLQYPTYGPTGLPILSVEPGHRILVRTLCSDADNPDALSRVGATGSIVPVM